MKASRDIKFSVLAVTAVALVAAGGAYAAGKFHGSRAPAASGLAIGSYVSSQSGRTANDHGGPGRGAGDDFAAAETYLGLSQADLQAALQSGKTLAQIADATSGKSATGLIDALVAAEQTELATAVTAGKLTQAQADQITTTLKDRFTHLVNGTFPTRRGDGPGPGFGGAPPAGSAPQPGQSTHI